jgi:ribosomal protein L37AE/L43A
MQSRLVCPSCGSKKVHRSKRKGFLERVVLGVAAIRPYRCENCDKRFLHTRVRHETTRKGAARQP